MTENSYTPVQNGIRRADLQHVSYIEHVPVDNTTVAALWELKTTQPLEHDFIYTVMPDACIDLVFDLSSSDAAPLLMTPFITIETIALGRTFHHIGIRFKPGVFTKSAPNVHSIIGKHVNVTDFGAISLERIRSSLRHSTQTTDRFTILESLAAALQQQGFTAPNRLIDTVVTGLHAGKSVEQVAIQSGYSTRQLRRITKAQTGYSPMQLYRVLRFQAALSDNNHLLRFTDGSHLIKEFQHITGTSYRHFVTQFR